MLDVPSDVKGGFLGVASSILSGSRWGMTLLLSRVGFGLDG